jgi:transcriptional regulator with XRE-family HTH domain
MLQGADELSRADEHTEQTHLSSQQSRKPSLSQVTSSPDWPSPTPPAPAAPPGPLPAEAPSPAAADLVARLAGGEARQEFVVAREIRAAGMVGGLNTAQIAADIHDRCAPLAGTSRIRAYRLALGVSLADVVAQIRAWYASEGRPAPRFSETLLSAYESGQKRPGPEYLHYLCAVYRTEPSDLGYPGQCFCGRPHRAGLRARPAAQVPAQLAVTFGEPLDRDEAGSPEAGHPRGRPAPGLSAVPSQDDGFGCPADPREAEDDDDVLRRAHLRMIVDAAAGVDSQFLGAVDRIRRRMDDALVGGTVSATMLDQWEETTAGYGIQYLTMPPLRLLCDVLLDFGDVRRMCEHRQPLDFSERLCRLAAQLAGLAGMIMIDVGHQRLARSFFRTARTAGDETGDRQLRAWIAVREALVPLYYGDPAEAVAHARTGAGLAGRNVCVAAAMAPVIEARALARVAARRGGTAKPQGLRRASALLDSAHEALSRLPATDRGDTAFGYTERQLLFHEGDTLVTLAHHQGAERALKHALRLYSTEEVLDRSLASLGLARCRLEADQPEEALRLSKETLLAVPREHRSEIMVRTARSLGDSVAGRHGEFTAVREYREALATA